MRIGKKTIHSVIIGLAMALPILYLGGSMIAGLCGAHGEQLWVDPVYTEEYVEVNSTREGGNYKYSITTLTYETPVFSINYPFEYNGADYGTISFFSAGENLKALSISSPYSNVAFVNSTTPAPFVADFYFEGNWGFVNYFDGVLYELMEVPTAVVPENNSAYSVFLFENFFPKNNFVERIGENALSENPKGFSPFGTMLRYLDSNMFHAGDTQTGLMVYGMVYWSLHVIIADLVYHVLVFVPNLINKVFDWFGQRGLNDD